MSTAQLPALNATLNACSGLLLLAAFWAVRGKRIQLHRNLMLSAVGTSVLFLISYLYYHYQHGSTRFSHEGTVRAVYLGILLTHTVLAASLVPLVLTTLTKAVRGNFESHRRWAKITYPIWVYVSITGVIIYFMLYQWFPAAAA